MIQFLVHNNKVFKIMLFSAVALALLVAPSLGLATSHTFTGGEGGTKTFTSRPGVISFPDPLRVGSFAELLNRIVRWLLVIGAPILTLMVIIGAFQILTAGGSPDKVTTGRKTITYAVIGYALLLLSTGITTIIENVLKG